MPIKRNTQLARNLRNNSTPQERKLWYQFLSTFPLRFHLQKVIDNFIVDFYCHEAKLVIEVDGGGHFKDENIIKDDHRTECLRSIGLDVIRFTNKDIDSRFRDVCAEIVNLVQIKIGRVLD